MRERAGGPVLDLGPVQGWGKVPAADASNTLHTACLWSEFSGCGQCGGGRKRTSYKNGWRKRVRKPRYYMQHPEEGKGVRV